MARITAGILIAALVLVVTAGAGDGAPPGGIAPPTRIPDPVPALPPPAGKPVPTSEIPRLVRRAVVADAARRFSVPESAVVLSRAERVTWPDASLGCAEPGRSYRQGDIAGFRVVARSAAGALVYHTDSLGTLRNCAVPAASAG